MAVLKNLYSPNTPQSYNAHNNVVNQVIDGVNGHSHDPNSANGNLNAGSFLSQFGSPALDGRYTSVGPGSSAWANLGGLPNVASIPADPGETAVDPAPGGTYSSIVYGHGIGMELARIRGQLAKMTGGAWYMPVGGLVSFSVGGSGRDLTVGALIATTATFTPGLGVAPFSYNVSGGSPIVVTNLNSDLLDGFHASANSGTANTVLATNAQGTYPQGFIAADTSEATVYINPILNTNTVQDNLNNIRFILQKWAQAALGPAANWNTVATTKIPFVSGLTASGAPITGSISFVSGLGIQVSQSGPNQIRFDSTGTAPYTDAPVLNYPDLLQDTVVSGSVAPSTTALTVSVNGGMIGYVNGVRSQSGTAGYSYGPYPVVAGTTNYIYWNGGTLNNSYQVTQSSTPPTGTGQNWILAFTGTVPAGATAASAGTWTLFSKAPILNAKPTVTGLKTTTTYAQVDAKVNSLISQLAAMGFIVDGTT